MTDKLPRRKPGRPAAESVHTAGGSLAYRPLPAGSHGLDPQQVRRDQGRRLRAAMIELIAAKGYPAVRISDLAKLAHVSPPTLYSLYADKEQLFMGTYEDVARRAGSAILEAHESCDSPERRLLGAMRAFTQLAASEPQAVSLLVLGAFGAGPNVLRKRAAALGTLEAYIRSNRAPAATYDAGDLTVRGLLGGVREVTAARLFTARHRELPALAGELSAWAACYPASLPDGLAAPDVDAFRREGSSRIVSQRARLAGRRLPSGRSDLPRAGIVKSQRERIVDATAAIAAEKGLAGLTIPEIARRANVSNQTFYAIYPSKDDAFLGAQKVGMHQALLVTLEAFQAHAEDWPRAVAAGIGALLGFLASEPAHAHLTLVDTFAASPRAISIRQEMMSAFGACLRPGYALLRRSRPQGAPDVVAEAVVGGIWELLHHYIEKDSAGALPGAAPQLVYFALAPFLGAERATAVALADA